MAVVVDCKWKPIGVGNDNFKSKMKTLHPSNFFKNATPLLHKFHMLHEGAEVFFPMNEWFFFMVHTNQAKLQPEHKTDFMDKDEGQVITGHAVTNTATLALTDGQCLQAGIENTPLVAEGPALFLNKLKGIKTNSTAAKLDSVRKFASGFLHSSWEHFKTIKWI